MVDVNYYARKIWNLANGLYLVPSGSSLDDESSKLRSKLSGYVDALQIVQFEVIKSNIKMLER